MAKYDNPTKFPALDVEELYIDGKPFDGAGQKIFKIAPLKNGESDPDKIAKKVNEIIANLKAAGLMENQ